MGVFSVSHSLLWELPDEQFKSVDKIAFYGDFEATLRGTPGRRKGTNLSEIPQFIKILRERSLLSPRQATESYFHYLEIIQTKWKTKDLRAVLGAATSSLAVIAGMIVDCKQEYGRFDILAIPAIDYGLKLNAIYGNQGQLENIKELVYFLPELHPWRSKVEEAYEMMKLSTLIQRAVSEQPGIKQSEIKKVIGQADGRLISRTIALLEKCGMVRRVQIGKTHELSVAMKISDP